MKLPKRLSNWLKPRLRLAAVEGDLRSKGIPLLLGKFLLMGVLLFSDCRQMLMVGNRKALVGGTLVLFALSK